MRSSSGDTSTPYQYTGQLSQMEEIGLYYYVARWYDPYLNRFLSPDSIISDQYNPLDWDRFSYARNNPVRYTDPTGHMVDDGCDTEGCDIDKIGTEYEKKLHYYQNCESGEGGGCPDYAGAITFTVTGLVTAGTAGTLIKDVGIIIAEWVASVVSSATTFACMDGDCGNEFEWVDASFPKDPSQLMHIFRNTAGHLTENTAGNRELLLRTISPDNFIKLDKFGNQVFARLLENGSEVWVYVRDGIIQNGGVNKVPQLINLGE